MARVEITAESLTQIESFAASDSIAGSKRNCPACELAARQRGQAVVRESKKQFPHPHGDYRIIFSYAKPSDTVRVWRIGYRGDIYD